MISKFFIDRPIFAAVLSIVLTLAGAVAVFTLPIAQYPDVTPPTVLVTASYPGRLGTAVFSGMIGVTLFGIFLTPVFYYSVQWLGEKRSEPDPQTPAESH